MSINSESGTSKPNISEQMISKWQKIVDLMSEVIGVPSGLIMKVHPDEIEVFISSAADNNPYEKGEKAALKTGLYSEKVMEQRSQLLVPDAREDPEWAHNPDIELGMVSYLGLPLIWPDGEIFGTICVLDTKKNPYNDTYQKLLAHFREVIEADLKLVAESSVLFKRVDDDFRESEQKFKAIFDNATYGILLADTESKIFLSGNETICRMLGYSVEEIESLGVMDIHPEEDLPYVIEQFERQARREITIAPDIPVKRKDDTVFYAEVHSTPIKLGDRTYLLGIFRDITEHRRAEEALRESERLLSKIAENFPNSYISIIEEDYTVGFTSGQEFKKQNLDPEQFVGLTLEQVFGDKTAIVRENYEKTFQGEESSFELFINNQHQIYRTVPLQSDDGSIHRILAVVENITDRRQTEERESRQAAVLMAINKVFQETLVSETIEEVAYTCINMAEELTGSEYGLIGEVNEAGRFDTISYGDLGWAICKIPESDAIALSKNMLIRGIWGQAILKGESQIVNDTTSHPESLGFPEGHPQIVNFMGVPLKDKGKTIGMIGLANKEGGYEPADQEAVEALSVAFVEALRRKRAEEALRASEEKYRTIVENSYDIIYSTDSDGKLIYVSPQVIHILGYRPDEMAGHYGVEFVHPDDVKKVMEDFERTIRTGEEFPSEFRFTTKDGSHVHVEEFGKIIRKGDKVAGITGIIRDITERKQAEEALRDSEATIRNIIELSNDAIYLLFEKKFVLINRKFSEMLGVTPDEVQTPEFNFMELIAPQSRSLVAERSRMRARGEEPPSQYEFTVLTRDGREIEVEASVKNIEYRGGMAVQGILRDITERKRAGEALRRSEHLFRQSIENSPNPVFSIDENGKILTWNPACEKVFQYEKEIIGQGFQILFDESVDCKYIESLVEQVFQRQEILSSLEMTFKCKDGSKRSMITRVYPISDKNGKVESCVFTNTDITERKRAEEALRQSEHLFRQSIENSPNPIFSIDENGKILTWNPACEKVFQYEKEIIGQGFQILFDESTDCKYFESLVEQVFQKQEILSSIEMSFKCKDGSNRFMITRVYPTLDINGKMESCVFTNTDITERMQSEMALKESEEKLSGIIKSIPDFISIIDEDYNIVWANDTVKNTFGQDVEKNKCYQAYHRSEAPCEDCIIRKVFADGETHEHEAETINAEGVSVFQLSVASAASRYPDGRPKTVIEISRDVTEFRKLQDQFRQAQKMEAIGRLAGGVAHDFNNLLTVIGGNTQLAMMALSEDDPLMHELNQVKKATQRASKLTYQLLAFSRKQVLKPEILSLNSLIADTKKMLHRVIGEDIELKTFLADDLWNVKADSGQFEQIVMNLCVNARDAMPDGGKLIVETENVNISEEYCADHPGAEPGSYVMLSVSDSGVGMTQSVKSQIFDPFYTTKAAGEGTGLGLSTVFGIVKQSGGFIYVYSELGEGTTIKIYLPSTEEEAKIVRKRVFTDEELRGKETILVVEDEEGVRNIAVMSLKKYGYRVIEAENGGAAYLKCKKAEQPMDLIVTDVVMPDMNGKELVESVREFWPDIKVLFMSGYTYNVIAKKGIIESEVSFLQKPFDPKDILQKVREAIDK